MSLTILRVEYPCQGKVQQQVDLYQQTNVFTK